MSNDFEDDDSESIPEYEEDSNEQLEFDFNGDPDGFLSEMVDKFPNSIQSIINISHMAVGCIEQAALIWNLNSLEKLAVMNFAVRILAKNHVEQSKLELEDLLKSASLFLKKADS